MSARLDILNEIRTRLALIRIANGYNTNAGALIFLGEKVTLGSSDPEQALAIEVRDDEPGHQGMNVVTVLPIEIQAIVKDTVATPILAVENVIADIRKAIETDQDLGGLALAQRGLMRGQTRVIPREEGLTTMGAGCEYQIHFAEKWRGV